MISLRFRHLISPSEPSIGASEMASFCREPHWSSKQALLVSSNSSCGIVITRFQSYAMIAVVRFVYTLWDFPTKKRSEARKAAFRKPRSDDPEAHTHKRLCAIFSAARLPRVPNGHEDSFQEFPVTFPFTSHLSLTLSAPLAVTPFYCRSFLSSLACSIAHALLAVWSLIYGS